MPLPHPDNYVRHKFVCFDCRQSFKRKVKGKATGECPSCRKSLVHVGYKVPIPKKSKVKEWEKFRKKFFETKRKFALIEEKWRVREKHEKEKRERERERGEKG